MDRAIQCRCGGKQEVIDKTENIIVNFYCNKCKRTSQLCILSGMLYPTDKKTIEDYEVINDYVDYDHSKLEKDEYGFYKRPLPRYTQAELEAERIEREEENKKWQYSPYYD